MTRAADAAGSGEEPRHRARKGLRARIRAETADVHTALEAQLDLLGPGLTRGRYVRVLQAFYGYYQPFEARLRALAERTGTRDLELRDRSALLSRDLAALGLPDEALDAVPRCDALPELSRLEHLAGSLYVLEGASLGGRVIGPEVHRRLGLTAERGCAFFTGDGPDTPTRWRGFLRWLGDVARDRDEDAIVGAARAGFLTLASWSATQGVTGRGEP